MVKLVASGLLVLALAMIAGMRPSSEPVTAASIAPALPTKVREPNAAPSSKYAVKIVSEVQFGGEWFDPPFRERYLDRLDWKRARLEERLALSPDQQARVAAWREQVAQRLETAKSSAEANHFATPRELEAFLRSLLDEEQAAVLAAFKQEERLQAIESLTSGQISRLAEVVGLKAEQKLEVAAAIAGNIEAVAAFRLDDPRPLEAFSSNFDKDPQALGIEQLSWEWLGEFGLALKVDHPRKRQFIKEVSARIDARVASLEPVLTPGQRETYREYLQRNWSVAAWHLLLFPPLDPER